MIPALDPDLESDFQLFGDSVSGLKSSKKWNRTAYRGVLILALYPDAELDFALFGDSGCGFESSKKWNRSTSNFNR